MPDLPALVVTNGRSVRLVMQATIAKHVRAVLGEVSSRSQASSQDETAWTDHGEGRGRSLEVAAVLVRLLAYLDTDGVVDPGTGHLAIPPWAISALNDFAWDRAADPTAPAGAALWVDVAAATQAVLLECPTAGR